MFDLFIMGFKGLSVLQGIIDSGKKHLVSSVTSSRDPGTAKDYFEEIETAAKGHGIEFFNRKDARVGSIAKFAIAIGWRWMIENTENPKLIVLHDSILPKYRGFNPLVSALVNGESQIGVTAIFADKEFDCGDVIGQRVLDVKYPIKIEQAISLISEQYVGLVLQIFSEIENSGGLSATAQEHGIATYSLWRDEDDYLIDWSKDSSSIERFINSVGFPYKGAFSYTGNAKVRILDAKVVDDLNIENRTPGKVLMIKEEGPVVVCGRGLLMLTRMIEDKSGLAYTLQKFRTRFKDDSI